jgi:hypothetical protein
MCSRPVVDFGNETYKLSLKTRTTNIVFSGNKDWRYGPNTDKYQSYNAPSLI